MDVKKPLKKSIIAAFLELALFPPAPFFSFTFMMYKNSLNYIFPSSSNSSCSVFHRPLNIRANILSLWRVNRVQPIILFSSVYRAWSDKKRIIGRTLVGDRVINFSPLHFFPIYYLKNIPVDSNYRT